MKKLCSVLLAVAMLALLGVGAAAADLDITGGDRQDVTAARVVDEPTVVHRYRASITWGTALVFTYKTEGDTYTWNTDSLTYDRTEGASGWEDAEKGLVSDISGTLTLLVTNFSDAPLDCVATLFDTPDDGAAVTVDGFIDNSRSVTIPSAVSVLTGDYLGARGAAQIADLSGTVHVTGSVADAGTLGYVTVTLRPAP